MKQFRFKNFLKSYSKGFTLIELLIYSVIFAVVAGLLTGIFIVINRTQTREVASFELQRQLQFVTQRIQHAIRDASVVENIHEGDNPLASCVTLNHCSLRLRTRDSATDPTTISSDAAGVYIQEGLGPRTSLTAAGASITSLRFTKTRNPGGLLTVAVDLAMIANSGDPQFEVARSLASAVAHVSAATFNSDLLPSAPGTLNVGGATLRWNNLILSGGINIRDVTMRELAFGTDATNIGGVVGTGVISMMTNHGLDIRTNNISRMVITNIGNIGIGTTAPTRILGIGGESAHNIGMERRTTADTAGLALTMNAGGATSGATNRAGGDLLLASGIATGTGTSNIHFQTATAGVTGTTDSLPNTKMTILGSGNVGIGTTAPFERLHVADGSLYLGPNFHDGTYGRAIRIGWEGNVNVHHSIQTTISQGGAASNGMRFFVHGGGAVDNQVLNLALTGTGNVGIGTATPTSILAFGGDAARTIQLEARTTNAAGSALTVAAGAAGAGATGFAGGQLNIVGGAAAGTTGAAAGGDVRIIGGAGINTGAAGNVILAATAGNVGIGTTTPGGMLEIASSAQNAFRLRRTAGVAGSVDLFSAVGDATARTGTALCQTVVSTAICLGQWTGAGAASACATSIASGRVLCSDFGD